MLAIALGAAAADRAVLAGRDSEPAARAARTTVTRTETSTATPQSRATPTRAPAPTRSRLPAARAAGAPAAGDRRGQRPRRRIPGSTSRRSPLRADQRRRRTQRLGPGPTATPETPLREVPLPAPVTEVVEVVRPRGKRGGDRPASDDHDARASREPLIRTWRRRSSMPCPWCRRFRHRVCRASTDNRVGAREAPTAGDGRSRAGSRARRCGCAWRRSVRC